MHRIVFIHVQTMLEILPSGAHRMSTAVSDVSGVRERRRGRRSTTPSFVSHQCDRSDRWTCHLSASRWRIAFVARCALHRVTFWAVDNRIGMPTFPPDISPSRLLPIRTFPLSVYFVHTFIRLFDSDKNLTIEEQVNKKTINNRGE